MGERSAPGRYGRLDDTGLAALVRKGDMGAFEALYDRHHAPLLAFCRHMCGSHQDGEDVLQQTFLRAHRALSERPGPDAMRPWLFAIARNRCLTLLAARREAATMPDDFEPAVDGLAEDVGRRADLRELLHDLAKLPDEQREALVLFELGGSSQAEIAQILACPPAKVKALVFQARTTLIAERDARSTPCEAIREQLAVARGSMLRRGALRRHLRQCAPCEAYRLAVAGQRDALASLLPVLPTAGLKAAILGAAGLSGGGASAAAAAGGAASAAGGAASSAGGGGAGSAAVVAAGGGAASAGGLAVTALVAKVAVTAAVAGAGVSGAVAAVDSGTRDAAPQVRAAAPAPARTAQPPRRQAPARAPADPSTGTPGQPALTPAAAVGSRPFVRRRAVRRLRARRARRATFRRARRAAIRRRATVRPRSTAPAPRREALREARRESRPPARREARRQARREAALPGTAPRPGPRPVRPRPAVGDAPSGPRPVRPRPQPPAPTPAPEVTVTPEASVAPTAVPTP